MRWPGSMRPASRNCRRSGLKPFPASGKEDQAAAQCWIGPPPWPWHFGPMRDAPADDLPLAAEFPAATYAQWRQLAERVLKGARFEERLESRTSDGLTIEAL